jgi:hypothetical protein
MDRIIREVTEIELHPNNMMNREDGFCLAKSWKPLICSLRDRRKPPSRDSRSGFSVGPRKSVHSNIRMDTPHLRSQGPPSDRCFYPHIIMQSSRLIYLPPASMLISCSTYSTLEMEATCSSETSYDFQWAAVRTSNPTQLTQLCDLAEY